LMYGVMRNSHEFHYFPQGDGYLSVNSYFSHALT
jgi:hypothetical protein